MQVVGMSLKKCKCIYACNYDGSMNGLMRKY